MSILVTTTNTGTFKAKARPKCSVKIDKKETCWMENTDKQARD